MCTSLPTAVTARAGSGNHPAPLAANLRLVQSLLRLTSDFLRGSRMRCRLPFAQDQQNSRAKNAHKEEQLVADNWPDKRHLRLARRQPARLAQLMQTR